MSDACLDVFNFIFLSCVRLLEFLKQSSECSAWKNFQYSTSLSTWTLSSTCIRIGCPIKICLHNVTDNCMIFRVVLLAFLHCNYFWFCFRQAIMRFLCWWSWWFFDILFVSSSFDSFSGVACLLKPILLRFLLSFSDLGIKMFPNCKSCRSLWIFYEAIIFVHATNNNFAFLKEDSIWKEKLTSFDHLFFIVFSWIWNETRH